MRVANSGAHLIQKPVSSAEKYKSLQFQDKRHLTATVQDPFMPRRSIHIALLVHPGEGVFDDVHLAVIHEEKYDAGDNSDSHPMHVPKKRDESENEDDHRVISGREAKPCVVDPLNEEVHAEVKQQPGKNGTWEVGHDIGTGDQHDRTRDGGDNSHHAAARPDFTYEPGYGEGVKPNGATTDPDNEVGDAGHLEFSVEVDVGFNNQFEGSGIQKYGYRSDKKDRREIPRLGKYLCPVGL